jgi:hypothetical protein
MIDVRIAYSHTLNGDKFYDVYANHRPIGTLTNMLSSGYTFRPIRNAPIVQVHTFKSLTDAIEKLPQFVIEWLALAALKRID